MKLKELYRSIACATLVAPALVAPTLVFAQDAPEIEEVVVTGSLIRGTPVDAALPVEVYSQEDLKLSGSPSALDFAKSLSISGATSGESYYFGGADLTGSVSYNLRGIGADKTLSLFNGRRVTQNTSVIPSIALARTEILKDGAAVTYGADATGGVVNFISRDSFEGVEVQSSYKAIDGSDGDYTLGIIGGFSGDTSDFIWAAQWEHRSRLDADQRDFTNQPYAVNSAPFSTLTNLAGWLPRGTLPATQTYNPASLTANGDWGGPVGGVISDFTQSSCEAVGGVYVNAFTCSYNYIPYYNLVSDNDIYRLYSQFKTSVTDSMDFYVRAAYSMVDTPYQYGSPSQPVVSGPAIHGGATYQLYVPKTNPFVADFAQRTGFANNPAYAVTQGFTPITYRAFAHGGLDTFAEDGKFSTPSKIRNKFAHLSSGFEGEFSNGITYDIAATYNQSNLYADSPDMMLYNVQEALNGFGGPNCNVPDLNPNRFGTQNDAMAGSAGCSWYNPFASNFASQPVYGLANPSYIPGAENPDELIAWMFNERATREVNWNLTFDAVFSGETPLQLPGGTVGWAAGTQFRTTENQEIVSDPLFNGSVPCANPASDGQVPRELNDPLYNGCTAPNGSGPFQFFSTNVPDYATQDQTSVFGELSLPVFDSLYLSAAVRYEEFTGGLDSTVYKVSGQYTLTDNLSFRGSYGTNYQAPGADVIPGETNNGTASYSRAGNNWRGTQTVTLTDIVPEEATVWSAGSIWQSEGFTAGSDFRFIVDYFNIETENELGLVASVNQIANSVFNIAPPGSATVPTNGTAFADCSHPLISRVEFNGSCVQGTTTAADFARIRTDFGNGPSQTTSGFDIQTTYGFPAFRGDVTLSATATKIQEFKYSETVLDGFVVDPAADRLGFLNFATIANAVSEWRGNVTANYSQGDHNFRLQAMYVKGVKDDRYFNADGSRVGDAALTPAGRQPGTTTPFGPSLYGVYGEDWITLDFHYTMDLINWDATLTASVENMADEMPPASRQELGYDPRIGNPLGRTFQVGLTKRF